MTAAFHKKLEDQSGLKLKLKINDNRSTMLSVKWEPGGAIAKLSLHRIFLDAPTNVMDALACYLRQEERSLHATIRAFIESSLQKIDYSHLIDRNKLYSQGNVYNLQKIYEDLNKEYFDGKLSLFITWFGKSKKCSRSRVTFGLYHNSLKLIKINRILDSPAYPDYLISYVVYHEMVHHICPAYFDQKGQHRIHTREFKEQEAKFRYYDLAQNWIKKNQDNFFC